MRTTICLFVSIFCLTLQSAFCQQQKVMIRGPVLQKLSDQKILLVECAGRYAAASSYKPIEGLIGVYGHPDFEKLVDNDSILITGTLAGTFEYTNVAGAAKTVRVYRFSSKISGK